jgi:hypothetical protein
MTYGSEYVTMNNMGCKSNVHNKPLIEGWTGMTKECKTCINKPKGKRCSKKNKCKFSDIKDCITQTKCSHVTDDDSIERAIKRVCDNRCRGIGFLKGEKQYDVCRKACKDRRGLFY